MIADEQPNAWFYLGQFKRAFIRPKTGDSWLWEADNVSNNQDNN